MIPALIFKREFRGEIFLVLFDLKFVYEENNIFIHQILVKVCDCSMGFTIYVLKNNFSKDDFYFFKFFNFQILG